MSQHRWPSEPTIKAVECLRGCGTTRQKYDARRWFYQAPGTMGGMRTVPCPSGKPVRCSACAATPCRCAQITAAETRALPATLGHLDEPGAERPAESE